MENVARIFSGKSDNRCGGILCFFLELVSYTHAIWCEYVCGLAFGLFSLHVNEITFVGLWSGWRMEWRMEWRLVMVVNKFRGSGSGFCAPPLHTHTEVTHNHVLLFVLLLFTYNMLPGKTNGARKEVMQTHDSDTKKRKWELVEMRRWDYDGFYSRVKAAFSLSKDKTVICLNWTVCVLV